MLAAYDSVWTRLIDISERAPSDRLARRSAGLYLALSQLLSRCPLPVMNPPLGGASGFSKLYHAASMAAWGWSIPRSCLTNSPTRASRFIDSCPGGVIFKGSSAVKTWATLYDASEHEERLRHLRAAPVLFQERIDGPDVRVHVVGERLFAEAIESSRVDYRVSGGNTYQPIEVPAAIAGACLGLSRDCALPLVGIDFKVERASGEWYFLEANPMPCYEGYDRRAGGAISAAIAEWLAEASRRPSQVARRLEPAGG